MILTEEQFATIDTTEARAQRAAAQLAEQLEASVFGEDADGRIAALRESILGDEARPRIQGLAAAVEAEAGKGAGNA